MEVIIKEEAKDAFSILAIGDVFILPLMPYDKDKIGIKIDKECFLEAKNGIVHGIAGNCTVKRVGAELVIHRLV